MSDQGVPGLIPGNSFWGTLHTAESIKQQHSDVRDDPTFTVEENIVAFCSYQHSFLKIKSTTS